MVLDELDEEELDEDQDEVEDVSSNLAESTE